MARLFCSSNFPANGGIVFAKNDRVFTAVIENGNIEGPFSHDIWSPSTPPLTIVDAINPPQLHQQYVSVTSPKCERYKELYKAPNTKMFGMPVWNLDELHILWESWYSSASNEPDWKERFYKWARGSKICFNTDGWCLPALITGQH